MQPYMEDGFQREKCSTCGWVHYHNSRPTVSALIAKEGNILLSQRAVEPFKNKWDIPGGYMEEKETPEDALRREMKEEISVEIEHIRLFAVIGPTYYPFAGQELYNTDIYYVADPTGDPTPKIGSDVARIDWFSPDKLPDMAFESNVKAIKMWQTDQKKNLLEPG